MAVDLETVTLQGTYRIGFMAPAERSLAAGELYIEVGAGLPKLWVGAMEDAGMTGNMAVFATAAAAPPVPPVNRDAPYIAQEGANLTCTMGNWDGAPTDYAYQWRLDGADVGDGTATYVTTAGDVEKTAVCVVSATNAAGTTAAPPSNQVIIAPVAGVAAARSPAETPSEFEHDPPAPPPKKEEAKEEPHSRRNHR
jgi:hypothetical protein